MTEILHAGDLAEYCGGSARLKGKRVTVDSWTPQRTRVRIIVDIGGTAVRTLVKPEGLRKVRGGLLDD